MFRFSDIQVLKGGVDFWNFKLTKRVLGEVEVKVGDVVDVLLAY